MRNIIDAIVTIVLKNEFNSTGNILSRENTSAGYHDLEKYMLHTFADTFDCNTKEIHEKWHEVFSYLGNATTPPDMMLRGGDAIEVKKIVNNSVDLRRFSKVLLNSVYPKQKLRVDDSLLTDRCRMAEKWTEKDIIYAVGVTEKHGLKHLCFVYGRDYCASEKIYNEKRHQIRDVLTSMDDVLLPPKIESNKKLGRLGLNASREFARAVNADPLNATEVRICGMWQMENPYKVFDYIHTPSLYDFNFMCVINNEKWATLENCDKLFELQKNFPALKISDVKIKNPDKPEQLRGAKIITYHSRF